MTDVLAVDRRDGWVLLTLDRPDKRNALSIQLRDAVSDVLDGLAGERTINGVARDLLLTGRRLDAEEALRVGLVSQVVTPDELPALRRGAVELLPTLEL